MQNETAGEAFMEYGFVYKRMSMQKRSSLKCHAMLIQSQSTISRFLHFGCDAYIEVNNGTGILLVSRDPESGKIHEFGLNQRVQIKPDVYFAFVSTTPELSVNIFAEVDHPYDTLTLSVPYEYHPVLPRILIQELLGYYYRIRTPGYRFDGERHQFFELTYVDTGVLYTEVDGVSYTLNEKEMMIYGPGQFQRQHTGDSQSVSYVTILFRMENLGAETDRNWQTLLLNKVYPYNKKTYNLMKNLVQESSGSMPYRDSLMLCLLTETIIRLLQSHYVPSNATPASVARQNYRDELFERIITYVEDKIYEPLTIAQICQQFSISRSSLQHLFKNAVDQSPKKYISDMKLERSKLMLRENKYTVSEVSLRLGYSSIHYFSNAFTQKYHISPSEYAKRIY